MSNLRGSHIFLRALEPGDLDFLYELENDEAVWEVSNTIAPYSKFVLKQYLQNAHKDIYEVKQLRLAVCELSTENAVGFIDLFDFDPKNGRVGVGIIIFSDQNQNKGYATEAVRLICGYCFDHLKVHQIFANISADNKKSIRLFESAGFVKSGVKKDWLISGGGYKDEFMFQLVNPN